MDQYIAPSISLSVGIVVGVLYVFSGFRDSQKQDSLQSNPRVKNLLWVVGGAIAALFGDWKIITGEAVTQRGVVALFYIAGAVITIIILLSAISLGIYINAVRKRQITIEMPDYAWELVLLYLSYGYPRYNERLSEIRANASPQEIHNRENLAQFGQAIATIITLAIRDSKPNTEARYRKATIQDILESAEATVLLMGSGVPALTVSANYMRVVVADKIRSGRIAQPKFQHGNAERYETYLLLCGYKDRDVNNVCLPIEPPDSDYEQIPGAPDAFSSGQHRLLNCDNVAKGVRREIKDSIQKFFKSVDFKSVLSIPILQDGSKVGVLNIESNHLDILGQGDDMVERVARVLQPYCLLLGEVVGSIE